MTSGRRRVSRTKLRLSIAAGELILSRCVGTNRVLYTTGFYALDLDLFL